MKLILPLLFISGIAFGQAGQKTSESLFKTVYKKDSAVSDLRLLKGLLDSIHPGLYMHCTKAKFERHFDSLVLSIQQDLTETEFYVKIAALLARIKDEHTTAYNSSIKEKLQNRPVFPFSIYQIGNQFVISKTGDPQYKDLLGTNITDINGKPIGKIVSEMRQFISIAGENQSSVNYAFQSFPFFYFIIDSATVFNISLKRVDGTRETLMVKGIAYGTYQKNTRRIVEPVTHLFNADVAVLTVNTFSAGDFEYKGIDYEKCFDTFFRELNKKQIQNLVIDVRGNGGGNAEISNYLFAWLTDKPYYYFDYVGTKYKTSGAWKKYSLDPEHIHSPDTSRVRYKNGLFCEVLSGKNDYWWLKKQKGRKHYYKGKLSVLADGGCASTTGHFLALLKDNGIGKQYGTCSSGNIYSNDGAHTFLLPYSKILVRIPTAQFMMKVSHFTYNPQGICPDMEFLKSPEDFKNNSDSQLNRLVEQK